MSNILLYGASGFRAASAELAGKPVVVGRSGDLRLDDDTIEKKHARFTLRDGKVFVAPIGSTTISLGADRISKETEVAPGDIVLLARSAVVFVAADPQQKPSQQARKVIKEIVGYQRDRLLVRLLELHAPPLVLLALDAVRFLPALRLHAVAHALRPILGALAERPDAPPSEQIAAIEACLAAEKPISPVLAEREASERREAAALPPPPPLDEDADPELSSAPGVLTRAWHLAPSKEDVGHGFSHGAPPIDPSRWPRSPRDGAPMTHLGTMLVPAEYRTAGPDKVAIAVFQADDHVRPRADPPPRGESDATLLEDKIGGSYAVQWLDAETFARGPGRDAPEGANVKPPQFLRLRARIGDPNVGKVIPDWDKDPGDYVKPDSERGEELALARFDFPNSRICAHFGGTSFAVDNFAGGLGPFYLALEDDFGGANFGGGNAVLDLARMRIVFGS